jgi:phosphohistidine phosphatase SixA
VPCEAAGSGCAVAYVLGSGRRIVWLVRHACAGHKEQWHGDYDDERPLDAAGEQQARALTAELAPLRPSRLITSPARRCRQTLAPLAKRLGLSVNAAETLAKGHGATEVLDLLEDKSSAGAVLCTHGEVMNPVLDLLRGCGVQIDGDETDEELLLKGVAWQLSWDDDGLHLGLIAPLKIEDCPLHRQGPQMRRNRSTSMDEEPITAEDVQLDAATERLARTYATTDGPFTRDDVSDAVHRAADELHDAPLQTFVPLLAEKHARSELHDREEHRDEEGP